MTDHLGWEAGRDIGSMTARSAMSVAVKVPGLGAVGGTVSCQGCPGRGDRWQLWAVPHLAYVVQWDNHCAPLQKAGFGSRSVQPSLLPFTSAAPSLSTSLGLHAAMGCCGWEVLLHPKAEVFGCWMRVACHSCVANVNPKCGWVVLCHGAGSAAPPRRE